MYQNSLSVFVKGIQNLFVDRWWEIIQHDTLKAFNDKKTKIEKGQTTTKHQLDPPPKEKRNVGRNYPKDLLILANYAGDKWNKNSNKAIVVKKIIIAIRF